MTPPLTDAEIAEGEKLCEAYCDSGCEHCHTEPCEGNAPGDYAAHDRYWRANNVTSRRPYRTTLDRSNLERGVAARKFSAVGAPLLRRALAELREVRRKFDETEIVARAALRHKRAAEEERNDLRAKLAAATEALDEFYRRAT